MNKHINIISTLSFILFGLFAWKLAFIEDFQFFKLLNILGITFDILGILLLSYLILAPDKIKSLICDFITINGIVIPVSSTFGMLTSALLSMTFNAPSWEKVASFCMVISIIMIIPTHILFSEKVFEQSDVHTYPPEKRVKILGGVFLITGLIVQLVAAVYDFTGKS